MGRWPKEVTPIVLLEWRFYLMPSSSRGSFIARTFFCSYIVMVTGVGLPFLECWLDVALVKKITNFPKLR